MSRTALGGISVVHRGDSPPPIWVPIKPSASIYVGGLVAMDHSAIATHEGVEMLPQAAGVNNETNLDVPLGVCIGTNLRTPAYDSTGKCEYITDGGATAPHTNTVDYVGVEGPWSKGDSGSRAMVKVEMIGPESVLRAPLFNAAVGTAPSLLTATAGVTTGLSATTNACDFTPVAGICTVYCRSGSNAGVYRHSDDTSTTAATWDVAMPYDTAVGDTFVRVPLRTFGQSYVQIGATYANYIDISATPASNYFIIHVIRLDLSEAGNEFVDFKFDVDNFSIFNRGWTAESA